MTKYTVRSCVVIVPEGSVDDLKALAEIAGGYDLGLSIPLSASGNAPATHYGCHATVLPEFLDHLKGSSPKTKAQAKSEREALVEPTPLTEQEIASIQAQEAALVRPTDPDSETYQEDLVAFHDALTAIRAPLHAYARAVREHEVQTKELLEHERRDAKRELWHLAADAELSPKDLAQIRAKGIVSFDPEVSGEVLYGRAHLDHVASNNNLQVIEESL